MTTVKPKHLARGIGIAAVLWASSLCAQLEVGTWVRTPTNDTPQSMTMTIEACCGNGRRLTYHVAADKTEMVLVVETRLDGSEAPVMINGQPSGETMAITRLDAHHTSTILRMNGEEFGTSKATLSADGNTITVVNDLSSSTGGNQAGLNTETWVRK